jgi:hypothetical protein
LLALTLCAVAAPSRPLRAAEPDKPAQPAKPPTPPVGTVRLINGDLLHGRLLSLDPADGVLWRHPDADGPIRWNFKALDEIELEHSDDAPSGRRAPATLELAGDDRLEGRLVSLDADGLILDDTCAGRLTIRRPALRALRLHIRVGDRVLFSGFDSRKDWKEMRGSQPNAWNFRDGAFYAQRGRRGGIGRDLPSPDQFRIDFDAAWKGQPYFRIYLLAKDINSATQSCYMLYWNGDSFSMRRYDQKHGHQNLASVNVPGLTGRGKAEVSILIDRSGRTMCLLIDGRLRARWNDHIKGLLPGKAIVFYSYGRGAVRIRDLRVLAWDGSVPGAEGEEPETGDRDLVLFANDDRVQGTIEAIRDGKVEVKTGFGSIPVPLERVAAIYFKDAKGAAPRGPEVAEVTVRGDAGKLRLKLESAADGTLVGSHPDFGRAEIPLANVSKIRLNLQARRTRPAKPDAW